MSPSLFDYFDYRLYLKERYESEKKEKSFFSYRFIAQKTGIDHSLVVKIFNGKRHLSTELIPIFTAFFQFSEKEQAYFSTLVAYGKSRKEEDIQRHFEQLLNMIPAKQQVVQVSAYEYFQHWYYAAIRSLLEFFPFADDYRSLSRTLSPAISVSQARESIDLLVRLNLIEPDEDGYFRPTSNHITTGERWHSAAIRTFQQEMILLSSDAMNRHRKHADFSTITMSMNKNGMKEIRAILKECRQRIISVINSYPPEEVDTLFQLNMQLFPLVTMEERK